MTGVVILPPDIGCADSDGSVLLIDFMPPKGKYSDVMRTVIGIDGTVHLRSELVVRFNYGLSVPWVTGPRSGILCAIAGQTCWYLRPRFRNRGDAIGFVDEAIEDRVGERPCQPGSRGTLEIVLDGAACHDGLPPGEGMFLACSFWLADAYEMLGRMKDAGNCMSACSRCATTWSTV